MKTFLIALLLLGCATVPYQERFEEPWIAVAEVKLSDWEKLNTEQRAGVVMIIMTTYLKRIECYRATLNILYNEEKLIFSIKCTERIANESPKRSVATTPQGKTCGDDFKLSSRH